MAGTPQGGDRRINHRHDVFCKMCNRVTPHLDFRPMPVQFKCCVCGEYNKAQD